MNPELKNDPWNILLLVGSILAILIGFLGAAGSILLGVVGLFIGEAVSGYSSWVLAGIFVGLTLVSVPAGWVALKAIRGEIQTIPKPSPALFYGSLLLLIVALGIGTLAFQGDILPALLGPPAHVLAALLPVIAIVTLILKRSPTISQRRGWGHFMAGLWLSPISALILELIAAIPLVLILAVAINSSLGDNFLLSIWEQPDLLPEENTVDTILEVLNQPLYVGLILAYIGILIPLVEEMIKSIGLLPLIRRQISDAEGFLGGVLAGAGYGLFEALFLGQPGPGWAALMLARVGATMMHMLTAGLTGLGFARAKSTKQIGPLIRYYMMAVGLHALWNVAAVLMGVGAAGEALESTFITPMLGTTLAISGSLILVILSVGAYYYLRRLPTKLDGPGEREEPQSSGVESNSG